MNIRDWKNNAVMLTCLAGLVAMPMTAPAFTPSSTQQHRQKTKNQWRNLSYLGAGLAALGLIKHDGTLTALGIAGGLYSASRYEQDRKSQSAEARRRAAIYRHTTWAHNGHRYRRVTVWRSGHKYFAWKRIA